MVDWEEINKYDDKTFYEKVQEASRLELVEGILKLKDANDQWDVWYRSTYGEN